MRKPYTDAEYEIVSEAAPARQAPKITLGIVLFQSLLVLLCAGAAYTTDDHLVAAIFVVVGALQWPISRLFALLHAPRKSEEEAQQLAQRLRSGAGRRPGFSTPSKVRS